MLYSDITLHAEQLSLDDTDSMYHFNKTGKYTSRRLSVDGFQLISLSAVI